MYRTYGVYRYLTHRKNETPDPLTPRSRFSQVYSQMPCKTLSGSMLARQACQAHETFASTPWIEMPTNILKNITISSTNGPRKRFKIHKTPCFEIASSVWTTKHLVNNSRTICIKKSTFRMHRSSGCSTSRFFKYFKISHMFSYFWIVVKFNWETWKRQFSK